MEQTVEQKLKALWSLQSIHTKIDKIRQVRGELPIEVADLEDEIAGLETRLEKIRVELDDLEDSIVKRKNMIKDAQAAIKKYEGQLNEVKNNRERSEEHTSELQSRENLVCRLLLEKKKSHSLDVTHN